MKNACESLRETAQHLVYWEFPLTASPLQVSIMRSASRIAQKILTITEQQHDDPRLQGRLLVEQQAKLLKLLNDAKGLFPIDEGPK